MRIKSGSTFRSQKSQGAQKTKKAGSSSFASMVSAAATDPDEKKDKQQQNQSALLESLEELAKELAAGNVTPEEVTAKFTGMVIKDRYGDQGSQQGGRQMIEKISEMTQNDPNFVSKLSAQLKKLGKS